MTAEWKALRQPASCNSVLKITHIQTHKTLSLSETVDVLSEPQEGGEERGQTRWRRTGRTDVPGTNRNDHVAFKAFRRTISAIEQCLQVTQY